VQICTIKDTVLLDISDIFDRTNDPDSVLLQEK